MEYKSLEISWIFETDLTNMNAGEGSSNLKEIKSYNNGLPYISGQSMRHALREAMKRENKEKFKCTPEYPCGNIEECWMCDLFGYMLPGEGSKRWSPIKASPALGQIREPITTDLIFRMVEDIKCPNDDCGKSINPISLKPSNVSIVKKGEVIGECPYCNEEIKAPYQIMQALAYKQLIKNIYKTNLSVDIANIGLKEVPNVDLENDRLDGLVQIGNDIGDSGRLERLKAIIEATYNLSDFANQSREMVNASPDFVVLGLQKQYNHRLASALKMSEEGKINTKHFKSVVRDALTMDGTKIFVGGIEGVINNEDELFDCIDKLANENVDFIKCDGPKDAFNKVIASLSGDDNEGS